MLVVLGAHADPAPEYKMKAAFIYNFALLTEWPKTADPALHLCVMGQDPIDEALREIENKEVNGRTLHVVHLSGTADVRACQIVYVGELGSVNIKVLLRELGDAPTLTISDEMSLAKSGIFFNVSSQ